MDERGWMARAIAEARRAAGDGEAPTAALVVRGGELIAVGRNTKTSEACGYAHAEMNALNEVRATLGRRPTGVTVYVTLEPCAMCLGALTFAGVEQVVYGVEDPEGGAVEVFREHPAYRRWMPTVRGGVLREECRALQDLPTF